MSTPSSEQLHSPIALAVTDLTIDEIGDLSLWIGHGKRYRNVPNFVSDELCQRISTFPTDTAYLPSPSLPVMELLNFSTPLISQSLRNIDPNSLFSHNKPTHKSFECLCLAAPSRETLNAIRDCAGQAMLDGKVSIRHWDRDDIFLAFNALGIWAFITEAITAKNAWSGALRWMNNNVIPSEYVHHVTSLLTTVPWKDNIKGLDSGLSVTDMAVFLSENWLTDDHIDSMLSAIVHLCHNALSHLVPHTEIVTSDFAYHILTTPLLESPPTMHDYENKAPKLVLKLGSLVANSPLGIRIATISFSPPNHWAFLLVDCQTGTIAWRDSAGWAAPTGLEKRLKIWLGLFCPQTVFSALQALPCPRQTDGYSCGICAINCLKHHLFGDKPWSKSQREILRVSEFIDIMDISEHFRAKVSTSTVCSKLIISNEVYTTVISHGSC